MSDKNFKSPFRPLPFPLGLLRTFVRWVRFTLIRFRSLGSVTIGENVTFGPECRILSPSYFRVGDRVVFGARLHAEANVSIGSDCLISSYVSLVGNDHSFDDPNSTVFAQGRMSDPTVVLEGDNLIGFGSILIGNVRIGKGSIVGAGAVVTKDIPPNCIYGGVPAKFIRHRHSKSQN